MAIAVKGGHVSRAIDFYNHRGTMYFIVGGTQPWNNTSADGTDSPIDETIDIYQLNDIIGLKKIDDISLVRPLTKEEDPDEIDNVISYKGNNYKRITKSTGTSVDSGVDDSLVETKITKIVRGTNDVYVESVEGFNVGDKIRVVGNNGVTVEAIISGKDATGKYLKVDRVFDIDYSGGIVIAGAQVEGAHYVYISCTLDNIEGNNFPIAQYRQIGICTGVVPNTSIEGITGESNILRSAAYSPLGVSEYISTGFLEILDNRAPTTRDADQREKISLIIEF